MTNDERLSLICAYVSDPTGWDKWMTEWVKDVARDLQHELDGKRIEEVLIAHADESLTAHAAD